MPINLNIIILGIVIIFLIWLAIIQIKLFSLKQRLLLFFRGTQVNDLETILTNQAKQLKSYERAITVLADLGENLNQKANASIHKVSILRFNPFDREVGSDQSFSIALLNDQNNGLVISSIYTRDGCRVYAKPIHQTKSQYPLSKEEVEAIAKAASQKLA